MSQEIVEKKAQPLTDLTEMQRRFCDYLIFNEGRTTHQDAALHAGYSPQRARIEASELLKNPKIQNYLARRSAEINRSFAVTKHNYVRRQQELSHRLVSDGKIKDALGFETLWAVSSSLSCILVSSPAFIKDKILTESLLHFS